MKRLACIILIVTILVSGLAFVKTTHATQVSGTLTADTEWTIMDSPVTFNGTVTVGTNVTLTIDPGVTVNLGIYYLYVNGTLIAVGDAANKILFTGGQFGNNPIFFYSTSTGWSQDTNSGSIIQNVILNKVSLYLSASPKIDNCYFNFTTLLSDINVVGGSPIISNNIIAFNGQDPNHYATGITINMGAPFITNNEFDGNGYITGVSSMSSSSCTVSNNVFSNCWVGVKAQTGSVLTVEGNSFLNGNDGLDVAEGSALTINNNLIDSNSRYGINGGGYVDSNTITNNQIGIHNPFAGSIISNNNIVGNTQKSITAASASVNAQNNWWGIADTQTINQTIYDAKIDPSLGVITFVPFLNAPNLLAPAIPSKTPTITPNPTPMATPTIQPTVPPTMQPTITTPTPTSILTSQTSESLINQVGAFLDLNLIATATAAMLVLVWVIVILGYAAKSSISKYKSRNKKQA